MYAWFYAILEAIHPKIHYPGMRIFIAPKHYILDKDTSENMPQMGVFEIFPKNAEILLLGIL